MQQSNQPPKFVIPFAQNDPAKAVIPATSPDDTRASQALGFPPRTGLPPEAGGVPPQKADMNGVLNQLAGPILWALAGGRFPFDNAFAADTNVGGYPLGADLLAADARGSWISTANDNTANPDTVGAGWVPGYHYGATTLAGQTGGNVTLPPAQAAKRVITVSGTLTSNLVLIVPAWIYGWTFYNNTSGAFSVSVRTAGGSAAAIPQNGAPTPVNCDGTNCSLLAANVGPATSDGQALQRGQAVGRLINVQTFRASGTYTPTAGTRYVVVEIVGGGGGGAGSFATSASQSVAGGGGGGGAYCKFVGAPPSTPTAITIGAGGAGGAAVPDSVGGTGGDSSFGSLLTVSGGFGGSALQANSTTITILGPGGQGGPLINGAVDGVVRSQGGAGGFGLLIGGGATFQAVGGQGGASVLGNSARIEDAIVIGNNPGAGGTGSSAGRSAAARTGGVGGAGLCIVWEYS